MDKLLRQITKEVSNWPKWLKRNLQPILQTEGTSSEKAFEKSKNKLKIDPKRVKYDGASFKLVIEDENEVLKTLIKKQQKIIQDLKATAKANKKLKNKYFLYADGESFGPVAAGHGVFTIHYKTKMNFKNKIYAGQYIALVDSNGTVLNADMIVQKIVTRKSGLTEIHCLLWRRHL